MHKIQWEVLLDLWLHLFRLRSANVEMDKLRERRRYEAHRCCRVSQAESSNLGQDWADPNSVSSGLHIPDQDSALHITTVLVGSSRNL